MRRLNDGNDDDGMTSPEAEPSHRGQQRNYWETKHWEEAQQYLPNESEIKPPSCQPTTEQSPRKYRSIFNVNVANPTYLFKKAAMVL